MKLYKVIDNIDVPVESKEIVSANIITVMAGTNGIHGGDTGHGGRTVFSIKNESSTDMRCLLRSNWEEYSFEYLSQIDLVFGGDCELETFIEALEFAADTLRKMQYGNRKEKS